MNANYLSIFLTYLELGLRHITDPRAYDHMLFLLTLTVPFQWWQWRGLVKAASGFTIGHSLSMALAVTQVDRIPSSGAEFAIPLTILVSATYTLARIRYHYKQPVGLGHFWLVLAFGLVHGLGFSNFLHAVLPQGYPVVWPLLAFNLGVEFGQLIFIAIILMVNYFIHRFIPIKTQHWVVFALVVAAALSILLIFENKFW